MVSMRSSPGSRAKINGSAQISEKGITGARGGSEELDKTRWRLIDERGCQRWKYLTSEDQVNSWPQASAEKYFLGLDLNLPALPAASTPLDAARNGLTFFQELQLPPGNWGCEYGGPMFLLPGIVITWYVTQTPISREFREEITNYLFARQNSEDGGWGLHIEGESTMLGCALNYTALRLVGVDADDERMVRARSCLHQLGGAVKCPHWAKFWLSVLGVCEWDAVNPCPPELWLLPDWFPVAPWRWWVHMRQVFLPMSFIYSHKFSHAPDPLTLALRAELYTAPYNSINFSAHRNTVCPRDNAHPKSPLLNCLMWALANIHMPFTRTDSLKKRAEDWVFELIQREDENTDFACLGPVNGPMNTIACYIREGSESYSVRRHVERLHDFLWVNQEGMMCNGTNGVQVWDTAFVIQACVEAGVARDQTWRPMLTKALEFLEDHQIREDCRDSKECYRQQRKGAWPFSTRDQGYTVSDCTAEGLKSVIMLQNMSGYPKLVSDRRLEQAVDVLLTMQNTTGGFASYEQTRGNAYLMEQLNAAEVFNNIMVEYDYPECTTAVVTALSLFTSVYPKYRADEIAAVKARAVAFIRNVQRHDGSWYGSWGICFTYAMMFALESLASVGETYSNSERVRRACSFLLSKQNDDGGWGESYRSCETGEWHPHPDGSQVVQTAWAAIALMEADYPESEPIRRALRLLMQRQQSNGEWLQEGIEGVFNKTCMISYPNYKFIFPIRALGMFASRIDSGPLL